jgi:hypothetical protein
MFRHDCRYDPSAFPAWALGAPGNCPVRSGRRLPGREARADRQSVSCLAIVQVRPAADCKVRRPHCAFFWGKEPVKLEALPYHVEAAEHLRACESGLWGWFESDDFSARYSESVKLELLKSTYRLTREDNAGLYALADSAAERLEVDLPAVIYQRQGGSGEANAALVHLPGELAVMLIGQVTELLNETEMLALLGHEISHRRLYALDDGRYLTAGRLLEWCASQPQCDFAFQETDRLYRLHSEIFADAGALHVVGDRDAVISCLIKVSTGLKSVTPSAYLEQAAEVIEKHRQGSEGLTHPEMFMRARTLELAASNSDWFNMIAPLVRGPLEARRLDLLGQRELSALTRKVIDLAGDYPFMRSECAANLCERYFPGFMWAEEGEASESIDEVKAQVVSLGKSCHEYLCYVLLDFATIDPDNEDDSALSWTLELADRLGLGGQYEPVARKELKRRKDDLAKLKRASNYKIARANHA